MYRVELAGLRVVIAQLLPSWASVQARSLGRSEYLTAERVEYLYRRQQELSDYDVRIDSSAIGVDALATQLESAANWYVSPG